MRAIGLLVALAATFVGRSAAAEELTLAWRAPPGCPSGESVQAAALKSAGATRQPLDADAEVQHDGHWRVTIRTTRGGARSERTLDAASCEALAEATAVILAIAMIPPATVVKTEAPSAPPPTPVTENDTTGAAETPASAAAPVAPNAAAPALPPPNAAEADTEGLAPRQRAARVHRLAASLGGTTDGTTLPAAAAGGKLGLAWTPGRGRVEIAGSLFSAQSKTTGASAAGAKLRLLVAGARGCWSLVQGVVDLAPCGGVDLQMVSASGYGAAHNYDASASWLSATAGALVRLPLLPWLALCAEGDAVVPASRPRFVVEGDGAIHKPAALGLRAGIGAELLFL